MTTRSMYLEELNSLRKSLAEMGAAVEESFNLLRLRWKIRIQIWSKQIIRGDRVINDMERSIESQCLSPDYQAAADCRGSTDDIHRPEGSNGY